MTSPKKVLLTGGLVLVTGGAGFIGSALVRALVHLGARVRVLDDASRGSLRRLRDVEDDIELIEGDVRSGSDVDAAVKGVSAVCHLAYINGTQYFYTQPYRVLEVAVKGMSNVLDACGAHGVRELLLVSSSEVYQTPATVPTDERVPLSVPDPLNPRYSYGGGKIVSELMAINYGRTSLERALIVRPHNVYGPDMGDDHVIPQLTSRLAGLMDGPDPIRLPIQGDGTETRAFVFIEDAVEGILRILAAGQHLGVYNVGTEDEVTISALAQEIGRCAGREVQAIPSDRPRGSPLRRCPDISKLRALGYRPRFDLPNGLARTVPWYLYGATGSPAALRP